MVLCSALLSAYEIMHNMWYAILLQRIERRVDTVKYSCKLDTLREMARECAEDAYALYLVGLLAEHAEEEECTQAFLAWVREMLIK